MMSQDSDVNEFGFAPCTSIEGGEYDSTFDAGLLMLAGSRRLCMA